MGKVSDFRERFETFSLKERQAGVETGVMLQVDLEGNVGAPCVELSGFATDWAGSSMRIDEIPTGYQTTVGAGSRSVPDDPGWRG